MRAYLQTPTLSVWKKVKKKNMNLILISHFCCWNNLKLLGGIGRGDGGEGSKNVQNQKGIFENV